MSQHRRAVLFLVAAAALGCILLWGLRGLPPFGEYRGPYGDKINADGPRQRHVTNMATAVNFDYRALDTLGEEYILFAAVTGLALLLRTVRGEVEQEPAEFAEERNVPPRSDALRWLGYMLTALTGLFGLYVTVHAHLTPGGGFQGGAILGTACLLVYLVVGYREFHAVSPKLMLELVETAGAAAYALVGLATLVASGVFLTNVLPLGKTGQLFSGGTIPVINAAVGLEVAGGFVLMFAEFLKSTRKPAEGDGP